MIRFTVSLFCASCAAFFAGATDIVALASPMNWQPAPKVNSARIETGAMRDVAANSRDAEILRASDGLFYVTADVDGTPIRFVVDTGATVVVLTPADARKIGIMPKSGDRRAHIQTAAGSTSMQWTKISRIKIAGQSAYNIDSAIVRDGLKVSLLGQNFLSEMGSVTLHKDRMLFNQEPSEHPNRI
ncbi:MAG: retropepsin-like aspartic protease [Chakrabartia sp.]